jgi:hypothetical protein
LIRRSFSVATQEDAPVKLGHDEFHKPTPLIIAGLDPAILFGDDPEGCPGQAGA